jgi:hypothetical protein
MPVHVTIKINERIATEIHIARMDELVSIEQVSEYRVVEGLYAPHEIRYEAGVRFEHKYDEGIERCVELALAALREAK